LVELGHSRRVVQPGNFGGKPREPPALGEDGKPAGGPSNRRAEMWAKMKKVLEEGGFSLPDSDSRQADLVSWGFKFNSGGKLVLGAKASMRRRGVPSAAEADAVALCFSEPDGSAFTRSSRAFRRDLSQQYEGLYI